MQIAEIERFYESLNFILENKLIKKKKDLAGIFGISPNLFSEILGKRTSPKIEYFRVLVEEFDINPFWLLTGKGPMFTKRLVEKEPGLFVNETHSEFKQLNNYNESDDNRIPVYGMEATAGVVSVFGDSNNEQPVDYLHIPNLPKCDGAVFVTGDSMYPILKSGDIVAFKNLNDIQNSIFWGEMYLLSINIDGDHYVMIKYVQKSKLGSEYIRLVSHNQHHDPKDILLDNIKAMAIVKASVRYNVMG